MRYNIASFPAIYLMDRTQHERFANHAAQYAAVSERVLREGHTTRPDNTTKVYARGQKRWKVPLPLPSASAMETLILRD
jgi:hypothetical protein